MLFIVIAQGVRLPRDMEFDNYRSWKMDKKQKMLKQKGGKQGNPLLARD